MTHRDGLPRFSARSVRRSDAAHRKPLSYPSESLGKPPSRSPPRPVGGRRKALPMGRRIAGGHPPTRRAAGARSLCVIITTPRYCTAHDADIEAANLLAQRIAV